MNVILLISGKQGSGKTTLAKGLWNRLVLDPSLMSVFHWKFADPLYQMEEAIASVLRPYGIEYERPDKRLIQLLGTEWGRATLGADVWVKAAMNRVEKILRFAPLPNLHRVFIIDDARFVNEVEAFNEMARRESNVRVIKLRLEASEHVRRGRAEVWRSQTEHASETSLDQYHAFDRIIFTDTNDAEATLFVTDRIVREAFI